MSEESVLPYPMTEIPVRELTRRYPFTHEYEPVIEMQADGRKRWICWQNRDDLTVIAVCFDGGQTAQVVEEGWTYLQAVRKVSDMVADAIENGTFVRPPHAQRRIEPPIASNH